MDQSVQKYLKGVPVWIVCVVSLSQGSGCFVGTMMPPPITYPPGELMFTYPGQSMLGNTLGSAALPLSGATDVPLSLVIVGTTTVAETLTVNAHTFRMTVSDGTGDIPGRIEVSYDSTSVAFFSLGFLKPGTTYTITARQSNPEYFTTATFTTTSLPSTNPAALGNGYAVVLDEGSVIWPPGTGSLVADVLIGSRLVFTPVDIRVSGFSPAAGTIQLFGGEGNGSHTNLEPGRNTMALIGPYLGPNFQLTGWMRMEIYNGETITLDSVNLRGKFTDWPGFGSEGVGITDGSFFIISDCNNVSQSEFKDIILTFCTDRKYILFIGSFYAVPFTVTAATDINGLLLTATITSPVNGSSGVPGTTEVISDIATTTGQTPCISASTTTISMTLEDMVSGNLVRGVTGTYPYAVAGCNFYPILEASFTQSNPPLASGHTYKALTILDLTPVAGAIFTTQ